MVSVDELIKRRHKLGISAVELSLVIGMHGAGLSRIESGNVDCRVSTLNRISAGLDTIEKNQHAIKCGAIVLDMPGFKNTIFGAIISTIESLQERGDYNSDARDLADTLVQLICEKITATEE